MITGSIYQIIISILAIILTPLKSNIEVGLHSNNELRIDEM